jgi:hypothetical protein
VDDRPLQLLDDRRKALDRKRVVIRNTDGIWNVYFGPLKLGRLHERHIRIEDEYGRLKRHRVYPMSPDFFVTYLPERSPLCGRSLPQTMSELQLRMKLQESNCLVWAGHRKIFVSLAQLISLSRRPDKSDLAL